MAVQPERTAGFDRRWGGLSAARGPSPPKWEAGDGVSRYQVWADPSQTGTLALYHKMDVAIASMGTLRSIPP